jgi:hypothetical protein
MSAVDKLHRGSWQQAIKKILEPLHLPSWSPIPPARDRDADEKAIETFEMCAERMA